MARQQQAIAYIVAANPRQKGHQRAAIREYAEQHQLELAGEYLDEGDSRRGLGGIVTAIRNGLAKVVLVGQSRAARGDSGRTAGHRRPADPSGS